MIIIYSRIRKKEETGKRDRGRVNYERGKVVIKRKKEVFRIYSTISLQHPTYHRDNRPHRCWCAVQTVPVAFRGLYHSQPHNKSSQCDDPCIPSSGASPVAPAPSSRGRNTILINHTRVPNQPVFTTVGTGHDRHAGIPHATNPAKSHLPCGRNCVAYTPRPSLVGLGATAIGTTIPVARRSIPRPIQGRRRGTHDINIRIAEMVPILIRRNGSTRLLV